MKIGMILQSNNPEHVWNAFRLSNDLLQAKHAVHVFLLSEGVEAVELPDSGHFDISKKLEAFTQAGGVMTACGTCLELRSKTELRVCPIGTLADLVNIIEESDKMLTFG